MYRLCLMCLLLGLLSGCAGLAVATYGKKESASTNFALAKGRNQFSYTKHDAAYSKEEIVALWGKPDDTKAYQGCEILIYKDGTSWSGAGAFVGVVPIPLAVPTGSYKNRIYLRSNASVGLVQEYGEVDRAVGYICGGNECKASSGEKVNEPEVNAKEAVEQWCTDSF